MSKKDEYDGQQKNPNYWRYGQIYYIPLDKRIFPPKQE